jgi:GT2 family glycosyltransferase
MALGYPVPLAINPFGRSDTLSPYDPSARIDSPRMEVAVIVPNWNGRRWLAQCLRSLGEQSTPPAEIIVVDNGSTDGSLSLVDECTVPVRIIALERNTGFAFAANRGIEATAAGAVALVNTDVVLEPEWLERSLTVLQDDDGLAAVACKMLQMDDQDVLYDAGDILRRDGVCEQRGRFERDVGCYDAPGDVFAPCAGAALYRREALEAVGGFDERLFSYLEDVDLGLRLRLAGWRCAYEPSARALHAGGGSSWQLNPPVEHWVQRNTLLLVVKAFPLRWLPLVAYRQLGWGWHALRERRLRWQLTGARAALALVPATLRERRRLSRTATVPIDQVVPSRPIRNAHTRRIHRERARSR